MTVFLFLILSLFSDEKLPDQGEQDVMTTYYFIRHAEKDLSDPKNKDPHLTKAGLDRARNWSIIFKEVPFDFVLSTDFNRTRRTAAIIARSQKKEIEIYDHRDLYNAEFRNRTKGKTTLVVGHSNTNPQFVNLILGKNKYSNIDESESGSLFIVQVAPDGSTSSQVLYIN